MTDVLCSRNTCPSQHNSICSVYAIVSGSHGAIFWFFQGMTIFIWGSLIFQCPVLELFYYFKFQFFNFSFQVEVINFPIYPIWSNYIMTFDLLMKWFQVTGRLYSTDIWLCWKPAHVGQGRRNEEQRAVCSEQTSVNSWRRPNPWP